MAEDTTVTLRSTVKGNQEQPKVLYLLPWREADPIEWHYQPTETIMAEVFDPVDRDEFIRELRYRELIAPVSETKSAR